MKRTPRKLVLRSETLRTLANMDLMLAVGGNDSGAEPCPALLDTGDKACEGPAIADTGDKACRTGVAVVATIICREAQ